jgi:hypothetical protein
MHVLLYLGFPEVSGDDKEEHSVPEEARNA